MFRCCAVLWLLLPLLLHLIKIHSTDCFLSFHFVHIVWQQHHHHHHHDHDHDHDHISSAQLERNLVHRISRVEDLNEKSQQIQQQQQNHGKFPLPLSHTTQKLNCERKCWYFFSFIWLYVHLFIIMVFFLGITSSTYLPTWTVFLALSKSKRFKHRSNEHMSSCR